jgi:cysteine dioxygenase
MAALGNRTALDDLVDRLRCLNVRHPSNEVAAIVRAAARLRADELHPAAGFAPGRYRRHLIARTETFELLLLCWSADSRSPIHDHGGSWGVVCVQSGALQIDDYVVVDDRGRDGSATIAATGSFAMRAGDIDMRLPERDLHEVRPRNGLAISLHFYARPIDRFRIFDPTAGTCRSVESSYDALPPPAASAAG